MSPCQNYPIIYLKKGYFTAMEDCQQRHLLDILIDIIYCRYLYACVYTTYYGKTIFPQNAQILKNHIWEVSGAAVSLGSAIFALGAVTIAGTLGWTVGVTPMGRAGGEFIHMFLEIFEEQEFQCWTFFGRL